MIFLTDILMWAYGPSAKSRRTVWVFLSCNDLLPEWIWISVVEVARRFRVEATDYIAELRDPQPAKQSKSFVRNSRVRRKGSC